jgi:hypothetical protein
LGHENLAHLILLCRECHEKVHERIAKLNAAGKSFVQWSVGRKVRRKIREKLGKGFAAWRN